MKKVPCGDDREWLRRILREVHALEALNHPNIVRCSPCCARPLLCHCTVPLPAQVQALVARMPRRVRILPSGADAVRSRPPRCPELAPIAIMPTSTARARSRTSARPSAAKPAIRSAQRSCAHLTITSEADALCLLSSRLDWVGLGWVGLDWVGLGWTGLGWIVWQ